MILHCVYFTMKHVHVLFCKASHSLQMPVCHQLSNSAYHICTCVLRFILVLGFIIFYFLVVMHNVYWHAFYWHVFVLLYGFRTSITMADEYLCSCVCGYVNFHFPRSYFLCTFFIRSFIPLRKRQQMKRGREGCPREKERYHHQCVTFLWWEIPVCHISLMGDTSLFHFFHGHTVCLTEVCWGLWW